MGAWLEAWQAWWRGLAPRERLAVGLGGAAAALLLLYGLAWAPLQDRLAELRRRVAAQEEELAWMRQAAAEARRLRAAAPRAAAKGSLLALVDRTARAAGLGAALARVQPEGEGRVRVRLQDAPFDALARWLGELAAAGLQVEELAVEREARGRPGRVQARLRLARPAGGRAS
ncbi:MAG: type II secretion system protein M [Gammaproteobacteria bacterium]|nr:MAG: type II secretion system protein M [Gammaproteobacteria bacterium]